MNAMRLLCLGFALGASTALEADETTRRLRKATMPKASTIAVVAEGDFEPRSIGSYSLRIYAGTDPRFPYDHFIAGVVRPRDGVVERVQFADLDGDGVPEVVVIVRSVGSGGYLAADAFQLGDKAPTLLETVAGLTPDSDPIRALAVKLKAATDESGGNTPPRCLQSGPARR